MEGVRQQGEPTAIAGLLARIGTESVEPCADLDAVVAGFDISQFGRATAKFDSAELAHERYDYKGFAI